MNNSFVHSCDYPVVEAQIKYLTEKANQHFNKAVVIFLAV